MVLCCYWEDEIHPYIPKPVLVPSNKTGIPEHEPTWQSLTHSVTDAALDDIIGDGYIDFVLGCYGEPMVAYRGRASGFFEENPFWSGDTKSISEIRLADIDADGDLDIFSGGEGNDTNDQIFESYLYRNQSTYIEAGITLKIPRQTVCTGDLFWLDAELRNPGERLDSVRVYLFLEAYGQYWCAPSYQPLEAGFDSFTLPLESGISGLSVIDTFTWPNGCGQAVGFRFLGGIIDPFTNMMIGEIDQVWFGFN